ncbi:hypothetical protein HHK36_032929 [Tetracentron sinense]|uniref:F-box domain-containing protein n=1 Tax=Tetracentron sinense TaxID=13715 RepID=A0A835CWK0_TETSI|nr:hypothetical protein HHK36_032929 [Tetracentron sinense]
MEEIADSSHESTTRPKRPRTCSVDRISGLPDFVLHQILSLLPMQEAVKTGVLSKRWEHLWASVSDLDFINSYVKADSYVNFVNRTLVLYEGSKIRKFFVDFACTDGLASHLDSWIRFAVRRKVEELDLFLFDHVSLDDPYELPQHLYNNAYLTKLKLCFIHIRPRGLFSWRLLRSLSLSCIQLSDNLIQDILSGSPSLEVLDLELIGGLQHLNITSPSLKKLIIHDGDVDDQYDFMNLDSVVKISAPYLQSLAMLGGWYRRIRLTNLPCLVHATLIFHIVYDPSDEDRYYDFLRELLEKLHHVKDLTIGSWCMQVLSTSELKILPSPPSKRKSLILDTYLDKWDLPGIANLRRSSFDLETLVVDMTFPSSTKFCALYDFEGENYWKSSLLHNLKTVKIVGFVASHHEMDLVQFLLKHSMVLEKMDFDGENYWKSAKPFFQCLLHNLKTDKIVSFIAGHDEMDLVQFMLKHVMVLEKMVIYSERLPDLKWRKCFMPEELL